MTCGSRTGQLVLSRFLCPGIHQECIDFEGRLVSPKTFSVMGEKTRMRDWKNAIKIRGTSFRCVGGAMNLKQNLFIYLTHIDICISAILT